MEQNGEADIQRVNKGAFMWKHPFLAASMFPCTAPLTLFLGRPSSKDPESARGTKAIRNWLLLVTELSPETIDDYVRMFNRKGITGLSVLSKLPEATLLRFSEIDEFHRQASLVPSTPTYFGPWFACSPSSLGKLALTRLRLTSRAAHHLLAHAADHLRRRASLQGLGPAGRGGGRGGGGGHAPLGPRLAEHGT
jgi:hypothetical protein